MTVSKELQNQIDATTARHHEAAAKQSRLIKVIETLQAAAKHKDEAQAKLSALDETERQAMADWAAAGAAGKAPSFDHAARATLNQELTEATAKAAASASAIESLHGELGSVNRAMTEVAGDLTVHALAAVAEHAEQLAEEYRAAVVRTAEAKMALIAMERFLGERQNLDDRRTTAFLPVAQKAMRHEINIDQVEQRAFAEARERWMQVFNLARRINKAPGVSA